MELSDRYAWPKRVNNAVQCAVVYILRQHPEDLLPDLIVFCPGLIF
jgi:hypothetical protein